MMDGSEQRLFEYSRVEPFRLDGYVDLQHLRDGDRVVLRQYVRIKPDGALKLYEASEYVGIQAKPMVHITPKTFLYGVLVTIQQTEGTYKVIDWEFHMGVTS